MFSNLTIALIFGLGFGGWVYSKIHRNTGGNTQNALIVGAIAGIGAAVIIMTVLGMVFN